MIIIEKAIEGVSRQSLARFATRAQKLAGISADVAVLITGRRQIQQLNRRFRQKNKPTDVLSFPREDSGDIAICAEIAQSNAHRFGHSVASELKILILHGMLHLAGYDHESDNGRMEKKETRLRAELRLPTSLIQRTLNEPVRKERSAVRARAAKQTAAANKRSRV